MKFGKMKIIINGSVRTTFDVFEEEIIREMFQETFVLTSFKKSCARRVCRGNMKVLPSSLLYHLLTASFSVFCNSLCFPNTLFSFSFPPSAASHIRVDISCNYYARKMRVWQPVCVCVTRRPAVGRDAHCGRLGGDGGFASPNES